MKILALPLLLIASPAMSYSCYNFALDEVAVITDQQMLDSLKLMTLALQNESLYPGLALEEDTIFFTPRINGSSVLMVYSKQMGLTACGEDSEVSVLSNILDPSL